MTIRTTPHMVPQPVQLWQANAGGDEAKFTQADLDEAIEKAVGPLKSKVEEVIGDNKKLKNELRSKSEIKPEDMAALESENERLKADLTKAQKEAKDATTAAEKATKALEDESGFTRKLLVENGLKDTLIKGGVKDEDFLDALVTKFSQGASIVSEGDMRKAMLGDKELSAVVTEYLGSDAGKKFVAAPHNSGGGAPGGKGGATGKSVTQEQFDGMSPKDRSSFFADGGTISQPA